MSSSSDMPLRKTICATCPFRAGSKYAHLRTGIAVSALTTGRICHSTGSNFLFRQTGKPEHLCRGARDLQLQFMTTLGVIATPTDAAWNAQRVELGMKPTVIQDPEKKR